MGVAVFGVPVLMILSALTVTNEYRSGLIRTTFIASRTGPWCWPPKRLWRRPFPASTPR